MNSQNEDNNLYVNADNVIGTIADLKCPIDEIDSNSNKAKDLILELAQRLDAEQPSERMHAAEQQRKNKHTIAAHAQSAESVLTTIDGHNDNGNYDDSNLYNDNEIKQGPNKEIANRNAAFGDYDVLRSENYELKQTVKRLTSIVTADKISATEIEFTIPEAKYE